MNNIETFKDIVGWEGIYQVSNYGRVKRVATNWDWRSNDGGFIGTHKSKDGYLRVTLRFTKQGTKQRSKTIALHRLLAETFIPKSNDSLQVNHIDGNKLNNSLDNLEWVTQTDNMKKSYLNAGHSRRILPLGEEHHNSKLTEEEVLKMRMLKPTTSYRKLAKMFNISTGTVVPIIKRKLWKHI